MIYRMLVEGENMNAPLVRNDLSQPWRFQKCLAGPTGNLTVAFAMADSGLWGPPPKVRIPDKARFWFTEEGWTRYGCKLAAQARNQFGFVVKVIKRKNPKKSSVVYQDEFQVALLPECPRSF